MRTNIVIDDKILEEAMQISKSKTKKEIVNLALSEYVKNHKLKCLLDLQGKISFHDDYDHKAMRKDL